MLVIRFFADFKTVHGFYMIGSLFLLPLWCYVTIYIPEVAAVWCDQSTRNTVFVSLLLGRVLAALAEVRLTNIGSNSLI